MHADPTAPIPATTFPALHAGHCYASSCGRVTLYHGRWQDLRPLPVDAIITDQPYGTGWLRGGKGVGEFTPKKETAEWDVFDGLLRKNRVREKQLDLDKARETLADFERQVALEIQTHWLELRQAADPLIKAVAQRVDVGR